MARDKSPDKMAPPRGDDADDMPLPPSVVALKAAVYLMAVVLVAGFALLVYTLVSRVSQPPVAKLDAGTVAQQVKLEPGEAIQSLSLDRNLVALHVTREGGGSALVIYDLNKGETVRRINVSSQ